MTYTESSPILGVGTATAGQIDRWFAQRGPGYAPGLPLPLSVVAMHAQPQCIVTRRCSTAVAASLVFQGPVKSWGRRSACHVVAPLAQPMRNMRHSLLVADSAGIPIARPFGDGVAQAFVVTVRQNLEILRTVVVANLVPMVDILIGTKPTPEHLLSNETMFRESPVPMRVRVVRHPHPDVSVGAHHAFSPWPAIIRAIARFGGTGWGNGKCSSAVLAGKMDRHLSQPLRCHAGAVTAAPGFRYSHANFTRLEAA